MLTVLLVYYVKEQRFHKLLKTLPNPAYAALYHYASYKRYKKAVKFYDSYGLLYLVGKNLYYKTEAAEAPLVFDLTHCTAQREPDWQELKWFSVTTSVGGPYYFNSHKTGAFVNNSDETVKGLAAIKAKTEEAKDTARKP